MVGDGDAMGVAAEILEHILGPPEGRLAVDHPVLSVEWPQPGSEDLGLSQGDELAIEAELAALEGGAESADELATKDAPEDGAWKKEARAAGNPVGVIERQPPSGDDTMDMGRKFDFLIPGVQHTEEAEVSAEMSGSAGDFEEGFGTGLQQEMVEDLFVLQGERRQGMG
jgi:hypothetical protein